MDLRQLRYFLLVAEAGGFTRAAERGHVAQPALSSHIGRLEEELGVQLFERTTTGVELTRPASVKTPRSRCVKSATCRCCCRRGVTA